MPKRGSRLSPSGRRWPAADLAWPVVTDHVLAKGPASIGASGGASAQGSGPSLQSRLEPGAWSLQPGAWHAKLGSTAEVSESSHEPADGDENHKGEDAKEPVQRVELVDLSWDL